MLPRWSTRCSGCGARSESKHGREMGTIDLDDVVRFTLEREIVTFDDEGRALVAGRRNRVGCNSMQVAAKL
jgi:hypothetical protein